MIIVVNNTLVHNATRQNDRLQSNGTLQKVFQYSLAH